MAAPAPRPTVDRRPAAPPYASFYFDCDSTLSAIEGVDELTRKLTPAERADLLELTRRAMEGELPLARVYEERLGALAPGRDELLAVGRFYIENLVPEAAATVAALRFLGKAVGIVSGGLLQPVEVLADHLGIPRANVHAVPVRFDAEGRYAGFDHTSPLWQNLGKVTVLGAIPAAHRPVLFAGDGVTDLEAKPVVDLFVGFGVVERRARVEAESDVFVTGRGLDAVLQPGLSAAEKDRLRREPEFARLVGGPTRQETGTKDRNNP